MKSFALKFACFVVAGVGLLPATASASPITVNNFSFELPAVSVFQACPITGWTCSSANMGVYVPTNTQYHNDGSDGLALGLRVPDGSQAGYVNQAGYFSQDTSAVIADNMTYTLIFSVGHRLDFSFPTTEIADLTEGGNGTGNGLGIATTIKTNSDPGSGKWQDVTITYTTTSGPVGDPFQGKLLGIALGTSSDGGGQVNFDNVRLSSAPTTNVPEPRTLLLFGAGLAGAAALRRKKKAA